MQIGAADPCCAVLQHEAFVATLRALGAAVQTLPFVHGAFDSVFVKDSAVIVRREGRYSALLTNPRHDERRVEQRPRAFALTRRGVHVVRPPTAPLEGGDVVVAPDGQRAFMGNGFRSERAAAPGLERFLNAPVVPLMLVDPRLYHLDMVLGVIGDDAVLVCEEALAPSSRRELREHFDAHAIISLTLDEALAFAANAVVIDRNVVVAGHHPRVARELARRDYRVHVVDLSQFHFAGGSAACLVAKVVDQDRVAISKTAAMRSTAA